MNIAVKIAADDAAADAAADAYATPLAELNPAKAARFQSDSIWPYFERLRREAPVHFTAESEFGPYWSITRWDDIMAVDTNHGGLLLRRRHQPSPNKQAMEEQEKVMAAMGRPRRRGGAGFITMDEPEHSVHRKAVSPTVAPATTSRRWRRWCAPAPVEILDSLPIGEEFDWVDLGSRKS